MSFIALPSKPEVVRPALFSCFRVQENAQLCLLLAQDYGQRRGKKGALLLKRVSWTTLTLHLPRAFPPRTFPLLWALHSLSQDTLSKSSFPSRLRLTQQQTLGRVRPYLTTRRVCQLIPFLTITLCHLSDPQLMLGTQELKKADPRNTRQALAGVGTATLLPMTRRTVIAKFVTDTEIDHPLDLLRALP